MLLAKGTRVRVVANYDDNELTHLTGAETHVLDGPDYFPAWSNGLIFGYEVALYTVGDDGDMTTIICRPEELEPIIPEGSKPGDWEESPWQPEEIMEEVIVR